MTKWKKLPAYEGKMHQGCLNCAPLRRTAPLYTLVAVGFGFAAVTRDGVTVYSESCNAKRYRCLRSFEVQARKDPDHDWRLILDAPLRGREYQRQGKNNWVLIRSDQGFA